MPHTRLAKGRACAILSPIVPEDFRRCRREAGVAAAIWAGAAAWALGVSYALGSERPVDLVAGLPAWVVWGVALPWIVTFAVHTWYSLSYVRRRDDKD